MGLLDLPKKLSKKFEKPLDKKQILCYNKDVPRGEDPTKDRNMGVGLKRTRKANLSKKSLANPLEKTLDIKHKTCYNVYVKRKENLTNQKGNYYEESFPAVPRFLPQR